MKDNTDRMDKAIKDKLNGHEAHVPSNLWKSIESKLPPEPTSQDGGFFKNPFIISFLVMSVVITGIYLFSSVNTKEQVTTASVAIPAASSNMPIAGNADRYSNSDQNTYTSPVGLNNNTNDSKHTSPTGENTYGTQQKISPDGNNHYASKISSNNNSNATNRSIASTPNSSKSSGNNKHTTGINNSDKATQKQTTDQHSTIDQHKGSIEAGTINSNHTHQNTSTDKMNASASGASSGSKKTNVSTATDNGVAHNNPVIEIPEHPSADSETSQKNNQTIATTVTTSEKSITNTDGVSTQASQKHFSGEVSDTSSVDNATSNNTTNNNHTGANIGSIPSATENSNQITDAGTQDMSEGNTIQTAQTKNNQQTSADDLSDMRAYFGDSMVVADSPAIIASAASTTNNKIDSINTDKKNIDSSSIQKNPEVITTSSQDQKKHTSVFLSKCSFDGFITPAFGYIYTTANTSIVNSEDSLNKFIQNRNQNTRTGSGITAGLRMSYALSKKFEAGIGFQYSNLSQASYLGQKTLDSSYYTFQGYTMTDSIYDSIQGTYIHRQYFVKTDSAAANSYTTQTKKFIDKYQNFSIPIFIAYGYSVTDRLSLLARTSLLINYQLYSVTYLNETEDRITGYHSQKNISLGGSFSIGGYYAFSRSCSVFAEPAISYYFSNLFDKQAPLKQTLLMFGLQTGIRLSF